MANLLKRYNVQIALLNNVGSALFSRLAPKAASTILFILLMRQFGPATAGAYTLSISFLTSAILFSSIGLDELVLREVAKYPFDSRKYLVNTLALRSLLSVIGYLGLAALVMFVFDYEPEVRNIVLLQGVAILPEGLTAMIFAILNANSKLSWMAWIAGCASLFQLVGTGSALWLEAGLPAVISFLILGSFLGLGLSLLWVHRLVVSLPALGHADESSKHWHQLLSWQFCIELLKRSFPFFVLIALVSLDSEIDVILLSNLRAVGDVGEYGAARTIIMLLSLLPQAFRMVIYPTMSRAYVNSESALRRVYADSWYYLALIGFPLTVGAALISQDVAALMYRQVSAATVCSLSILMGHLLIGFLYLPGTRLMVVSERQMQLSLYLMMSLIISGVGNLFLVPIWGAIGTATTRVLASLLYFALVEIYVGRKVLPNSVGIQRILMPVSATLIMGLVVWAVRSYPLYTKIGLGVLTYSVSLVVSSGLVKTRR